MNQFSANRRTLAFLALLAGAFVVTHMPASSMPTGAFIRDDVLHFCGYAVLAAAGVWRAGGYPPGRLLRTVGFTGLFLALYAGFDEATQPLVGRSCEMKDVMADFLGIAAIMFPSMAIMHRRLLLP